MHESDGAGAQAGEAGVRATDENSSPVSSEQPSSGVVQPSLSEPSSPPPLAALSSEQPSPGVVQPNAALSTGWVATAPNVPGPAVPAPTAPARPAIWPIAASGAISLTLMMGGSVVVFFAAFALAVSRGVRPEPTLEAFLSLPWFFPLSALVTEVSLLCSLLPLKLVGDAPRGLAERIGWEEKVPLLNALLLGVACIALGSVLEAIAQVFEFRSPALEAMSIAAMKASLPERALIILFAGLGAGLGEEVFFRGVMQRRLLERWSPFAAIVTASLAFGAIHADPVHTPFAFCIGLLFGWAAWRSKGILTTVFAHAINNTTSFALTWAGAEQPRPAIMIPLGLTVLVACVLVLRRRFAAQAG